MNLLCTLGTLAGGFFVSPPPRAAFVTLMWIGSRSHPVLTALMVLAIALAWSRDRD